MKMREKEKAPSLSLLRFSFCSGDTTTLTLALLGQDGRQKGCLISKSSDRFAFFLFTFPSAYESKLSTLLEMQKASQNFDWLFLVAGTRLERATFGL